MSPNGTKTGFDNGSTSSYSSTGTWIRHYSLYFIVIVGALSNILAICVIVLSKRMRSSPPGVLLLSLTVTDTVVLITERVLTLTLRDLGENKVYIDELVLILLHYLKYVGRCGASYIIACISVNRFAVIVFPIRSRWFLSTKNTLIQIAASLVLAFVFNFYVLVWPPIVSVSDHYGYFYGHLFVEIIITDVLISIVILVFSIITIMTLVKSRRKFDLHSVNDPESERRNRHITTLLLVVALTYIVLRWQYKFVWISIYFYTYLTLKGVPTGLKLAYYITYSIYVLNHAINLYQYCLCSAEFRGKVYRMFYTAKLIRDSRSTASDTRKASDTKTCETATTHV